MLREIDRGMTPFATVWNEWVHPTALPVSWRLCWVALFKGWLIMHMLRLAVVCLARQELQGMSLAYFAVACLPGLTVCAYDSNSRVVARQLCVFSQLAQPASGQLSCAATAEQLVQAARRRSIWCLSTQVPAPAVLCCVQAMNVYESFMDKEALVAVAAQAAVPPQLFD